MRDSLSPDAVRMRRNRHHRKGDHRYCSGWDKCDDGFVGEAVPLSARRTDQGAAVFPGRTIPPPVSEWPGQPEQPDQPERQAGGIEQAVTAFVEALPYREPDPRALLAQIAVRLAQRVDETGAMPAAVRELRVMLMQLTEVPDQPSGPLDVHRLRRAQHRLDAHLAGLGS